MDENEQKQQLSFAYFHAVASAAGYACYRPDVDDDSVDRALAARGQVEGVLASPRIDCQLKSLVRGPLGSDEFTFVFRLKRKNYDELRGNYMVPRLLIVLLLPPDPADWIRQDDEAMISRHAAYYVSLAGMPARRNASTVSVRLSRGTCLPSRGLL